MRAEGALARRQPDDADVVVVGYPGHFDMPAARRIARKRPVVFNPLVSLHDTFVGDRARFRPRSPAAGVLRAIDSGAFRGADLVVADTEAQADFFRRAFGLPGERVAVALVGAEEPLFRPGYHPPEPFHALFVGKLIPLHGLETILAAAALAPEIPFRVVGDGQLARPARAPPAERRARPVDPVRGAAGGVPGGGVRARHLRHEREGGARDPEQGLPGARVRGAGGHGGHGAARASC